MREMQRIAVHNTYKENDKCGLVFWCVWLW